MKKVFNKLALSFFSAYTRSRGYQFMPVATERQRKHADTIFDNEGYKLPPSLLEEMAPYKTNTTKFIAYYKGNPVATVGLANPGIANRPYDLHGIDPAGDHFEIQSLIVSKGHRECSQLVLLGLFKEMYVYSVANSINSWISFGLRQLYLTLRKYNKRMCVVTLGETNNKGPLATYLYEQNVFDSCAIMRVEDFEPADIFLKFVKKQRKKMTNKIRFLFL